MQYFVCGQGESLQKIVVVTPAQEAEMTALVQRHLPF